MAEAGAQEGSVNIRVKTIKSRNPIVIEGFPGIGLVGNIATQHMIEELKMTYVGAMDSKYFPPIAVLFRGLINMPVRIYESEANNVVAVISDIPVHPTVSYEVSKAMIDWTVSIKAREIVSVAGIATMGEGHRVFGGATTPALLERVKDHVELFQVGTISGISGSIMTECFVRGIPAIGLLGETHSPNPDPRAAAAVIGVLNKIYNLSIRVENLIEQADQIETELKSLAEQVRTSTEGGEKPKKEFPMYG